MYVNIEVPPLRAIFSRNFEHRYSGSLSEDNFDMPTNVKFMSWLPQNDLLAHKKTKLFITHGGLNGKFSSHYQQ